ncbi:hypothetical protein NL676_003865 [Syzygium grande]|nr:hypothetical protein NL676_003865 [Syzygium grande]
MTKDNGCSKYTGLSYYMPRKYSPKRAYPWLTDITRLGMSSNKKQAIEVAINRPNVLLSSVYPLDKANVSLGTNSSCPSIPGQVRGCLVARPSPSLYTASVSLGTDGTSAGRKDFKDACQGDALANSHNPNDIVKAKVNDVLDSENVVSAPIRNSSRTVGDGRLLRTVGSNKYYGSFLASGGSCQIKNGNDTPMDMIHNEGLNPRLTLGSNCEEETNTIASGNVDGGPMEDTSCMAIVENKATLDYRNYTHLSEATSPTNTVKPNARRENINVLVIGSGGCNAHQTSSGNNEDDKGNGVVPEGVKVTANVEATTNNQNSTLYSEATSQVGVVEPKAPLTSESNPNLVGNAKNQKACRGKKLAMASEPGPDIYPLSNQSLLSTGVFDGAPVKYTLRSRNYITPCDFERHAGGKTRKPYSCIYLKNGKSISQVCQEVRTTPKDMLFHRLPEIAGSAFGWLSFNTGKGPSDLDSSPAAPLPTKMSNFKSLQ